MKQGADAYITKPFSAYGFNRHEWKQLMRVRLFCGEELGGGKSFHKAQGCGVHCGGSLAPFQESSFGIDLNHGSGHGPFFSVQSGAGLDLMASLT